MSYQKMIKMKQKFTAFPLNLGNIMTFQATFFVYNVISVRLLQEIRHLKASWSSSDDTVLFELGCLCIWPRIFIRQAGFTAQQIDNIDN